ncbi:MAG: hypothetical protein CMG49_04160 [Candidatus Marinimicrobia bacterium]|nr:hypothetical protein [Candidatus Neomarinimicrobiota bacterium]|tara:strand:- start:1342 stop:2172 length:831 start_codon:yes stop_codon:yes gene_type:complete
MLSFFKIIRIHNILIANFAASIAYFIILENNLYMLFLSSVCITFIMMYGNMLNDYLDMKSDMISHPNRPLPQKKINLKYLRLSIGFCLACSILLSFYFNHNTFMFLLLIIIPLLTTYNFYFKGLPLIGNMIIAFLLSSVFLFIEIALTNTINITIIPSMFVFGLSLIREVVKDMHDIDGDKNKKFKTLPIVLGFSKCLISVLIFSIIFMFLLFIPYFCNFYGENYLISLIVLVEIPMFVLLFLLKKTPNQLKLKQSIFLLKIISITGSLVILIANR